jgi:hypothetical protein
MTRSNTPAEVEVEMFFNEPLLPMVVNVTTGTTEMKENDPMLWWRHNARRFPMLASLAQRYLGPPPSSVASERLFSTAGDVCSASRTRLLSDNAEMLIMMKVNLPILNPFMSKK